MKKIKRTTVLSAMFLCFSIVAIVAGGIMFAYELNDITNLNVTVLVIGAALLAFGAYGVKFGLMLFVSSSSFGHVYKALATDNLRNVKDIASKKHMSVEKVKVTIQKMFNKGIIANYRFDQTGTELIEISFSEE